MHDTNVSEVSVCTTPAYLKCLCVRHQRTLSVCMHDTNVSQVSVCTSLTYLKCFLYGTNVSKAFVCTAPTYLKYMYKRVYLLLLLKRFLEYIKMSDKKLLN